jgi:hypothetical protein
MFMVVLAGGKSGDSVTGSENPPVNLDTAFGDKADWAQFQHFPSFAAV